MISSFPVNILASRIAVSSASVPLVVKKLFFSLPGVIFASLFRESRRPDADFGWNVAGIILGGLSEQLSLVVGFNYLLVLAVIYYLFSALPRAAGAASTTPSR